MTWEDYLARVIVFVLLTFIGIHLYQRIIGRKHMSIKAMLITKDNREAIERQFDLEEDYLDEYVDFWILSAFGARDLGHIIGSVTQEDFKTLYEKVGDLENGFVEVKYKEAEYL